MVSRTVVAILMASAGLLTGPALAQNVEAGQRVSLSGPVKAALAEAQRLQKSGDHTGALAKIAEAEAFSSPSTDDVYYTASIKLNSGIATKNNPLIEEALGKMLSTGKVSAADQPRFIKTLGSLALQRKDYKAAAKFFEQLVVLTPNDTEPLIVLGELYSAQRLSSKAIEKINQAIAVNKAAGVAVPEAWYRRSFAIAYDDKLTGAIQPAALALVAAYPSPVNWKDSLLVLADSQPELLERGALDFWRLRAATGSLIGEGDFINYGNTASGRVLPGEADYAIKQGIAKGMLNPSDPRISELSKTLLSAVSAQKATLPGLEIEAATNPEVALYTADIYYGYGEFSKAAALYRKAIGGGNIDSPLGNLRLGAALARAGDKAGAKAVLTKVKGGFNEALASYWMVFVAQ